VKYDVLSLFELEKCFENFLPVVKNKTLRLNTACRSREIKDLRHTFCFIARLMKYTHANIGKYLNRHHTTVINSVKTFRNLYQTDEVFKARYHNIINHIKNKHESPIMENLDKI
jgi:chromosomal replication initiation ATPase DnaA